MEVEMELEDKIHQIAEEQLMYPTLFVVSVQLKKGSKDKLEILIDGDHGVGIDDCANISRRIGQVLEEGDVLENAYQLEVSSPGVGQPLKLIRQYKANIGRKLKVLLQNGKEFNGVLREVSEDSFLMDVEIKEKKKKIKLESTWVSISEVNIAKVQVSFK